MAQDPSSLQRANIWSAIGIYVGLVGALVLGTADVVSFIDGEELIARPLHLLLVISLSSLVMGSLVVRVGVQVVKSQRQLAAELEQLLARAGGPRPLSASAGLPQDNVIAFELGRAAGRRGGADPAG